MKYFLIIQFLICSFSFADEKAEENVPSIFKEMGVVQNKAMNKANKFLVSTYGSMDFSDGPYTFYSMNLDLGYATSDFFEVYLSTSPLFISQSRSIVKKIESLKLSDGTQGSIIAARPKQHIGVSALWAPFYGKDSLGLRTIIRSDTFFKLGAGIVLYDSGSGMKFETGFGKTYFLSSRAGLRFTIAAGFFDQTVDTVKSLKVLALFEAGLIFYLF